MKIRTHALGLGLLLSAAIVAGSARQEAAAATSQGPAGPAAQVSAERLTKAADEPGQWMTYGGTYAEQRFSKLAAINRDNVKQLGLSWFADYDTNLQQTGTPLYIDGVLYVSTAWSKVYAYDAKSGKQIWEYNPKVPGEWAVKVCCGLVNRGIAAYNGKIYRRHAGCTTGRDRREERQGSLVDGHAGRGEPRFGAAALLDHDGATRRQGQGHHRRLGR